MSAYVKTSKHSLQNKF